MATKTNRLALVNLKEYPRGSRFSAFVWKHSCWFFFSPVQESSIIGQELTEFLLNGKKEFSKFRKPSSDELGHSELQPWWCSSQGQFSLIFQSAQSSHKSITSATLSNGRYKMGDKSLFAYMTASFCRILFLFSSSLTC